MKPLLKRDTKMNKPLDNSKEIVLDWIEHNGLKYWITYEVVNNEIQWNTLKPQVVKRFD